MVPISRREAWMGYSGKSSPLEPDPVLSFWQEGMTHVDQRASSILFYAHLAYVEGATHEFSPCTVCQTSPNQFGDTETELFNYVTNWLERRY